MNFEHRKKTQVFVSVWKTEQCGQTFSLPFSRSTLSSLARPSSWGLALWSSLSSSHSSSPRSPPAPRHPPSCPSARSRTQTAKSPCPRWRASTSTRLFRAATRRTHPPPATRTSSLCCRTVLFNSGWMHRCGRGLYHNLIDWHFI